MKQKIKVTNEKGEDVTMDRLNIIGQNGNSGLHYDKIEDRPRVDVSENEKVSNKINSYLTSDNGDIITYMEQEYPEMTSEFKRIQQEQYKLFCRKQYNYGKGNIMLGGDIDNTDDRKMALSGVVIRMNDKLNRLMNLILKNKKDVVDESVEDTFIDMANYSIISLLVNRIKWK